MTKPDRIKRDCYGYQSRPPTDNDPETGEPIKAGTTINGVVAVFHKGDDDPAKVEKKPAPVPWPPRELPFDVLWVQVVISGRHLWIHATAHESQF